MSWCVVSPRGCTLTLHIQPGARRTELAGLHGDALKIRLAAPPVEGKANAALIAFLAGQLGIARRDVVIESGDTSRRKRVLLTGLGLAAVHARLHPEAPQQAAPTQTPNEDP